MLRLSREDFEAGFLPSATAGGGAVNGDAAADAQQTAIGFIQMVSCMHRSMLAKDECAFHEGDVGDRFYIIEEGRTSVQVDGKEINQLQPGECFGETSLLTGEPRNATVRCVSTSCRLLSMDVSAFSRLIRRSNKLQTELSSLAATRVQVAQHLGRAGPGYAAVPARQRLQRVLGAACGVVLRKQL